MIETEKQEIQNYLDLESLNVLDGVNYAFSPRSFGNMAFPYGEMDEVIANRRRFLAAVGMNLEDVVFMRPVGKVNIEVVGKDDRGRGSFDVATGIPSTDALITTDKGVALALNAADCAPIIVTNKNADFLALYHAGREGTDKQIGNVVLSRLYSMGFTNFEDFIVGIGPLIKSSCYKQDYVQTNNPSQWYDYLKPESGWQEGWQLAKERINRLEPPLYNLRSRDGSRLHLDLAGLNWCHLIHTGVHYKNISISSCCTACDGEKKLIFSHVVSSRYHGTPKAAEFPEGRFMALAQLNP